MNINSKDPMDSRQSREILGIPNIEEDEFHFSVLDTDIQIVDKKTKEKVAHPRVHGVNSSNFIQQTAEDDDLRIDGIKKALDNGRVVVGGYYVPTKENPSKRSADTCVELQVLFFDLDEWTTEHPAPKSLKEFYTKYPEVPKYITILKESASSSSKERRFRGVAVLEHPLRKDPENPDLLKDTVKEIGRYLKKYLPFMAEDQVQPNRIGFGVYNPKKLSLYNEHAFIPSGVINYCVEQAKKNDRSYSGVRDKKGDMKVKTEQGEVVVIPSDHLDLPIQDQRMKALDCLIKEGSIGKQLAFRTPMEAFKTDTETVLRKLEDKKWLVRYWKKDSDHLYWKIVGTKSDMSAVHDLRNNRVQVYSDTAAQGLRKLGLRSTNRNGSSFWLLNIASKILYKVDISAANKTSASRKKFDRKLAKDGFGKVKTEAQIKKRNKVIDDHLANPEWCAKHDIQFILSKTSKQDAIKLAQTAVEHDHMPLFEATNLWRRPTKLTSESFQEFEYGDKEEIRGDLLDRMLSLTSKENLGKINLVEAETGIGKTYAKDQMIGKSDVGFLQIALTKDLAKEYKDRAVIDTYMWKSRDYNYEKPIANDLTFKDLDDQERIEYFEEQSLSDNGELDNDSNVMCIQAEKHQLLTIKGISSNEVLCNQEKCPVFETCNRSGYNSQQPRANTAPNLIYCGHTGVFMTTPQKVYEDKLMAYNGKTRGVIFLDDFKIENYSEKIAVNLDDLVEWRNRHPGSVLEEVSTKIYKVITDLDLDSNGKRQALKEIVESLSDSEISSILYYMERIPIKGRIERHMITSGEEILSALRFIVPHKDGEMALYIPANNNRETKIQLYDYLQWAEHEEESFITEYEYYEILNRSSKEEYELGEQDIAMTLGQALRLDLFDMETEEDINKLPKMYSDDWNPIKNLKRFFERSTDENAPIEFYNGTFAFYINNKLRNIKKTRLVILSGTANIDHIESILEKKVHCQPLKKVEWSDGSQCFQHNCGRFPRKTLLKAERTESGFEYTALSPYGRFYLNKVEEFMKADRSKKFAIITVKSIRKLEEDRLIREHENLVSIHNYGAVEGLDDISEYADVIVLIGVPERQPNNIEKQSKILYAADKEALSFDLIESKDKDETARYADPRVQRVFESLVRDELIQAAGRARLNTKSNKKLIIVSAQYLPGYSERAIPFEQIDLECVSSYSEFESYMQFKEKFDPWFEEQTQLRTKHVSGLLQSGKTDQQIISMLSYPQSSTEKILEGLKTCTFLKNQAA